MTKAGTKMPLSLWAIMYKSPEGKIRLITRYGGNTPIAYAKQQAQPDEKVSIWKGVYGLDEQEEEVNAKVEGEK